MNTDIGYLDPEEQAFYRHQEAVYGDFRAEMMYVYNPREWWAEFQDWQDHRMDDDR